MQKVQPIQARNDDMQKMHDQAASQLTRPRNAIERETRLAAMENAVWSQGMEGVSFTPAMRDRQRRFALGQLGMDALLAEALEEARTETT